MRVSLVPCGPAANESEIKAFKYLERKLESELGNGLWVLLTNLSFSSNRQRQSDEIDIVAIGPPGVRVIEVKHWTDARSDLIPDEADRVIGKARKIGSTLRGRFRDLPYVDGALLVTREAARTKRLAGMGTVRGVGVHTLAGWREAVGLDAPDVLSPGDTAMIVDALKPRSAVAFDSTLRRFAGYVDLRIQTAPEERFRRVYKGIRSGSRDRAVLFLYDLSAEGADEKEARREFNALHRLQRYSWAPRILDSWQAAPGYAHEMFFFTTAEPVAPTLEDRASDESWAPGDRAAFARAAVCALDKLHRDETDGQPMVHRNLAPDTVLVRHDNAPFLTGFERAAAPADFSTLSPGGVTANPFAAPEIRAQGRPAADRRSDVWSLCAALDTLFRGRDDKTSRAAVAILARGMAEAPDARARLEDIDAELSRLVGDPRPAPPAPSARNWTEEQIVPFGDYDYRIVERLGAGGVGAAYKTVRIDRRTREELGTYVAKIGRDEESGRRALRGHRRAHPHLGRHPGMSAIFEVAADWRENEFLALMTWIEGDALRDFIGVFPLLAEERDEPSAEALASRWLRFVCEGLRALHRNGLVHGDVSLRNMIVSGDDLVLTDYDCVVRIGESVAAPGTVLYCPPPAVGEERGASASDDIYALAASFFHVMFDREPFRRDGALAKERGLNWDGLDRAAHADLADFLDRATYPDPAQRFASADEAIAALTAAAPGVEPAGGPRSGGAPPPAPAEPPRTPNRVEWLRSLLRSYPGSRYGNSETRGLDTDFAEQTYVPTLLEDALFKNLRARQVSLVVLCGNAGDGKTALLQHLAGRLGLEQCFSTERIHEGRAEDGLLVRMNLDGSAAWRGRSADELLDEFLAPFRDGPPDDDVAHLLAINDGRLLEWIERVGDTPLTGALSALLEGGGAGEAPHIRFVDLNRRSLVGHAAPGAADIETAFLDRLVDALYGADKAAEIWMPCRACSARDHCETLRATRLFGPDGVPDSLGAEARSHARRRLFEALQAVHLRGETHVTMRELRAALVHILFGAHFCDDYHGGALGALAWWDRAFAADSPFRQGEVLDELVRLDPGLEAHPRTDRRLSRRYPGTPRESARRRAYFELSNGDIDPADGAPAPDLAGGRHLRAFRDLALEADPGANDGLRERLCKGISRLENLPPQALERDRAAVPLRIAPRTPTETAFWVEKALDDFRLEAELLPETARLGRLHRAAVLVYRYRDGREEPLRMGAELFHRLLELGEGYQLGDVATDDTFAHLSIFVRRLAREDEREMFAWSPMREEGVYRISAVPAGTDGVGYQTIRIDALDKGGTE